MNKNISVLISLYIKTDFHEFKSCFQSIVEQTLLPDEIVFVFDGEVDPKIDDFLSKQIPAYNNINIKIVRLIQNFGLGTALNYGLLECRNNIIVRVDSDDINVPKRFENQLNYFLLNQLDVVGSFYQEFKELPGDLMVIKEQPLFNSQIYKKSKLLNPISHPTVMFKKDSVLKSGSYLNMLFFEDYFLWIRMMKLGFKFGNLNEVLVHFRIGNGMLNRRHGINYFKNEFIFYLNSYKIGHINIFLFTTIVILKFFLRILPMQFMSFIYSKFK
jgi:glycosyltransferase involved in cell wall biosynthesis